MKKITKNSFESLRNSFPVLSTESLKRLLGGTISNDCVLNCFAYVGCGGYTRDDWGIIFTNSLGYSLSSNGGINTSDFTALGAAGGMAVNKAGEIGINPSTGKTSSGAWIMMEFPGANGLGHTVIVTGVEAENGTQYIKYYDPTTGVYDRRVMGNWSQLYTLSCTDNSSGSGSTSSSGSSSGNSSSDGLSDDDFYTINGSGNNTSGSSSNSSSNGNTSNPSGGGSSDSGTSDESEGDSNNSYAEGYYDANGNWRYY